MASQLRNRRGISNVVATIILIAVAIALAVAVAVWVFGLAGSSAKTATLNVQALGLTIGSTKGSTSTLTLVLSNPSSSSIGINGFTLGGLSCTFSPVIAVSGGTQGAQLTINLPAGNGGQVSGNGGTPSGTDASSTLTVSATSLGITNGNSITYSCTGSVTLTAGTQYSGELTTTSGQTYPFTVSS